MKHNTLHLLLLLAATLLAAASCTTPEGAAVRSIQAWNEAQDIPYSYNRDAAPPIINPAELWMIPDYYTAACQAVAAEEKGLRHGEASVIASNRADEIASKPRYDKSLYEQARQMDLTEHEKENECYTEYFDILKRMRIKYEFEILTATDNDNILNKYRSCTCFLLAPDSQPVKYIYLLSLHGYEVAAAYPANEQNENIRNAVENMEFFTMDQLDQIIANLKETNTKNLIGK